LTHIFINGIIEPQKTIINFYIIWKGNKKQLPTTRDPLVDIFESSDAEEIKLKLRELNNSGKDPRSFAIFKEIFF